MKILFVCTGNSCRSVMAKAYLEKRLNELGRKDIEVFSAGIAPFIGMEATKEAKQVLSEEGANIFDHRAKKVDELDIHHADLIFVMEERQKQFIVKQYPNAAKKTYILKDFTKVGDFKVSTEPDIKDPIGQGIGVYKEVFSIIKDSIERVLKEIA